MNQVMQTTLLTRVNPGVFRPPRLNAPLIDLLDRLSVHIPHDIFYTVGERSI